MPQFLESKLKSEYGADSKIPYKVMNADGYMHGNTTTPAGKELELKHKARLHAAISKKLTAHVMKGPETADNVNGD